MYYKEGYEQFIADYGNEMKNQGKEPRKFEPNVVMGFLARAYVHLGNTFELVEAEPDTIKLVSGQFEYTTGSGDSNLAENVLRVHTVKLQDAYETQLEKVGLLNMPRGERLAGLPAKWTVQGTNKGRKLIIDTLPDKSYADDNTYALTVYYKQKLYHFNGESEGSFTDLNFGSTDWGGEFKLPTEWDDLIINGAVAYAVGTAGLKSEFYALAEKQAQGKKDKSYVSRKPKYRLGIW